jgi:hypothetical protein
LIAELERQLVHFEYVPDPVDIVSKKTALSRWPKSFVILRFAANVKRNARLGRVHWSVVLAFYFL